MLIFFVGSVLRVRLTQHQFGKVSIPDILGSALREEIDVIVVIFKLILLLKFRIGGFGLSAGSFLYSQFFVEAYSPLIGVDVFVIVLDPGKSLLVSDSHLLFFTFLH